MLSQKKRIKQYDSFEMMKYKVSIQLYHREILPISATLAEKRAVNSHLICRLLAVRQQKLGFALGFKRCRSCEVTYKTTESNCPCCGLSLRTKRHAKATSDFYDMERVKHEIE